MEIPGITFVKKLGEGGMSSVWKAWDANAQRFVAVKILNREFSSSGEDVRAFRSEERLMEEIHHEGIVQAYDFDCVDGTWYFLMEYVDGYNFGQLLKRKQHVIEVDCLLICQSVANALGYAWNDHGLVHCDIKPDNIMINMDGIVKVTDLGISHRFQRRAQSDGTVPDHISGTPAYISPEQIYGDVELDCRADIYSLGATLFHLATGRVLFPGLDNETTMRGHCDEKSQAHDPRFYRPEISEGFAQMLEAMLVKDRDGRLQRWEDVIEMSRHVEAGNVFQPRESAGNSTIALGN